METANGGQREGEQRSVNVNNAQRSGAWLPMEWAGPAWSSAAATCETTRCRRSRAASSLKWQPAVSDVVGGCIQPTGLLRVLKAGATTITIITELRSEINNRLGEDDCNQKHTNQASSSETKRNSLTKSHNQRALSPLRASKALATR